MHIHDQALQKVQHPTCIFYELQSIIQCPGRIITFFKDIHTASKPRRKCKGQQKLEALDEKHLAVQQKLEIYQAQVERTSTRSNLDHSW